MTVLGARVSDVRTLDDADLEAVRRLIDAHPLVNSTMAARLDAAGSLSSRRLGGRSVGVFRDGRLDAFCFCGGALLPVGSEGADWRALAAHVARSSAGCASIVGRSDAVAGLWANLSDRWGPARLVRPSQPLLVTDKAATAPVDRAVRPVLGGELDRYLPAAAALYTEELEFSPFEGPCRTAYRSRLADLINAGRALACFEPDGSVIFKAEIGVISRHTAQVQGVWVRPDLRGRGVGTAAMASVVAYGLRLAPTVSLYVNDFNLPARKMYRRIGMRQVSTLATVLF